MNQKQKQEFIRRSKQHFDADMLLKGTYGRDFSLCGDSFKGCSIGCHRYSIESFPFDDGTWHHKVVADYYGFPEWLAWLEDSIFEGLNENKAMQWHIDFAGAMPAIDDWGDVYHDANIVILKEALKFAPNPSELIIQHVIDLHKERCTVTHKWTAAHVDAHSVAESGNSTYNSAMAATHSSRSAWLKGAGYRNSIAQAVYYAAKSGGALEPYIYEELAEGILEVLRKAST